MNKEMLQPLKVDITKLATQSEYAKKLGVSRQRINQMVKSKEVKTVNILGATLIVIE